MNERNHSRRGLLKKAGLGMSLSAKQGILPRELKVSVIQNALRKDEVDLTMGGKPQENVSKDRGA